MEMSERIAQFFHRIISLTNQMKACGEVIKDQTIIEKLKIEELQGSLEAHEQRLIERSTEKSTSQALQAQITRRGGGPYRGGIRNRGRGRDYRWKSSNQQDQQRPDQDHSLNTIKKTGANNWRGGKKRLDKKRIKCFNCNKIGHLSYECQFSPGQPDSNGRHQNEAHMAKEERIDKEDETPILLMMTTNQEIGSGETWYIDSGCSNHMTGHRNWLVNFDSSKKSKVRFADNRVIQAEGTRDVTITKKDGGRAMITDVLFVPNMKNNLISLGQLLEKGFTVNMQDGYLEIFDSTARKILRTQLTQNRTF
ncbi:PREDICTED: uncharacterized protein LOC109342308 [Lupinus angustifolius]|uniref:uncharacterized protein LOC109342308 n=1 Tax=Lupinus angustifolius TaxID=3871 RepID=UPI00092F7BA7|nr:PREDICTED: uncharacterized protein LOC109342308 [Lupinus angustifolius]